MRAMLSVLAMRRPEDEQLCGRDDEFVDISQMQLLVEGAAGAGAGAGGAAGPSSLHYGGPPPPLAQPQPYAHPPTNTVDDLFALYFTPTSQHGKGHTLSYVTVYSTCCRLCAYILSLQ